MVLNLRELGAGLTKHILKYVSFLLSEEVDILNTGFLRAAEYSDAVINNAVVLVDLVIDWCSLFFS